MTLYTHPDLPGIHGNNAFTLDEVQYPRVWWRTVSEDEIAALGFVEFVPPPPEPPTLGDLKAAKLAELADRRWQFEVSGFLWQRPETDEVYFISTDEKSQAKITAERKAAEEGVRRPGDIWKCGDPATGLPAYVALSNAEIIDMSTAARNRTSDGFNHEAYLAALVMAAQSAEELDLIDIEAGWPS